MSRTLFRTLLFTIVTQLPLISTAQAAQTVYGSGLGCGDVLQGIPSIETETIIELNRSKVPRAHVFEVVYTVNGLPFEMLAAGAGISILENFALSSRPGKPTFLARIAANPEQLKNLVRGLSTNVLWAGFEWEPNLVYRALGGKSNLARVTQKNGDLFVEVFGDAALQQHILETISHLPIQVTPASAKGLSIPTRKELRISPRAREALTSPGSDYVALRAQVYDPAQTPLQDEWAEQFKPATVSVVRDRGFYPPVKSLWIPDTAAAFFYGSRKDAASFLKNDRVRSIELAGEARANEPFWNGELPVFKGKSAILLNEGTQNNARKLDDFLNENRRFGVTKLRSGEQADDGTSFSWIGAIIKGPPEKLIELSKILSADSEVRALNETQFIEIMRKRR